jgi:hypothetical protein
LNRVNINGRCISVQGNNISVINGKVFVDGKEYKEQPEKTEQIILKIEGAVQQLNIDDSVSIEGDVTAEHIRVNGSINCRNIKGSIEAKGSINCDDIEGKVKAGGSINADSINVN